MLHIDTNKYSNNLNLKLFEKKDEFGNYNLFLNKNIIETFLKQMLNKNWDVESTTEKTYIYNNKIHTINLTKQTNNTTKKVFIKKHSDINIKSNINFLVTEYNKKELTDINFSCKKKYHNEVVNSIFYFYNPNKKIMVKIINENKIEIDLVIDHEIDVILRIVNELITDSGLDSF